MKNRLFGLCVAVVGVSASSVDAALISPVSASTTMGTAPGTELVNTINGAGLERLSLTAIHSPTGPINSWVSGGGRLTGDITFDLGEVFSIRGFSFWNQNLGGPSFTGNEGIRSLMISASIDNVTFTPVKGAPDRFAQALGASSSSQPFSFGEVDARYVNFSVTSNYGDPNQTGFAEVQFDAAASVPDNGSTLVLLGTLLLGFAAVKHRKPIFS